MKARMKKWRNNRTNNNFVRCELLEMIAKMIMAVVVVVDVAVVVEDAVGAVVDTEVGELASYKNYEKIFR